jgi:lanthanide-dependent methanol dehydrogenase
MPPIHVPRRNLALAILLPLTFAGCERDDPEVTEEQPGLSITGRAELRDETAYEDDGQWIMAPKDHANWRFSGLTEITTENVAGLQLAWTFSTGQLRGHEAAPIVVGDRMFIITPHPNNVFALDTRDGSLVWKFEPGTDDAAQGVACCDVVNRGVAYANGLVVFNTLDNQTIAVDAESGEERWRARLGDIPPAHRHEVAETRWLPLDEAPRLLAYKGEREMAEKARGLMAGEAL